MKRMGEEVVLFVEELEEILAYKIPVCRICHEAEIESRMEAPCSCSGTVKFAHRDCIQRWCDEKGNTTCEICLQNFEPGYTAPTKKNQLPNAAVSIRRSFETPELLDTAEEQLLEENELVADRIDGFCRLMALIITVILLVKNILYVLTGGTEDYPCTLLTLLIARTSGIIIPMYILIRLIANFRDSIRHPYEDPEDQVSNSRNGDDDYDQQHLH